MRISRQLTLGLCLCVGLAGCVGPRGPRGPVVSPTGIVYPPGIPPEDTRFSQTATLYFSREVFDRALEQAEEGVLSEPGNPIHHFLAGSSYARLGRYRESHERFLEAERLYPAYQLDIEPQRERASAEAFNSGLEAYASGDIAGTKEAWESAALIFDLRPEPFRNLAMLLASEGDYDQAIDVYQRGLAGLEKQPAYRLLGAEEMEQRAAMKLAIEEDLAQLLLFRDRFAEAEPLLRRKLESDPTNVQVQGSLAAALSGQGRDEEANEIYSSLLSTPSLEAAQLFNIGVALFRSGQYVEAGDAFGRLTTLQPNSRDAWFNYANSLFAANAWESLAQVGDRVVELDPLSENAGLISARAHLEVGDEPGARLRLERTEAAPVHVASLQLRPSGTETIVQGRVIGNTAEAGTLIRLRFIFYGDEGMLGSQPLTLEAPAAGQSQTFEVSFASRASSYRYDYLPDQPVSESPPPN